MADPQQYTDAQLSDGTTLRFLGNLGPDEVRQKVQAYRLKQAPTQNIPFGRGITAKQDLASMPGKPNPQSVQPSMLGQALNPNPDGGAAAIANPQQPAEQFALKNPDQQGTLAGAATVGAAGATLPFLGPPALAATAKVAKAHPFLTAMVGQEAIHQARQIPMVGKVVPSYAELLPWLLTGGKGEPEAEPNPQKSPPSLRWSTQKQASPSPAKPGQEPLPDVPQAAPTGEGALKASDPSAQKTISNDLERLLNQATGGQPVKPGVPMRDQMKQVPTGHTPVESKPLQSYKYDPDAREFHVLSKNGTLYTYGDVSPEDAQSFAEADSKGRAWGAIRQKYDPPIRKNGEPVKPTGPRSASPDDTMSKFQQMLDAAKAKKQ